MADAGSAPGVSVDRSRGASTANPWFWAVISTLPVGRSLHRLVDAAVAVLQLVGAEAQGASEHLVAEANAEVGNAFAEHALKQVHRTLGGRRVAGAVAEEDPVGAELAQFVQGDRGRQHVHLDAALRHARGCHVLDPEVDGGHREPFVAHCCDHLRGADVTSATRSNRPSRALPEPWRAACRDRVRRWRCRPAWRRAHAGAGSARGCRSRDADDTLARSSSSSDRLERQLERTLERSRTTYPATQMRADSSSSSFQPVLPMCGAVATTPGGGSWGRSGSPGSRTYRWRRPPRRTSRRLRRRTPRGRTVHLREPTRPGSVRGRRSLKAWASFPRRGGITLHRDYQRRQCPLTSRGPLDGMRVGDGRPSDFVRASDATRPSQRRVARDRRQFSETLPGHSQNGCRKVHSGV